MIELISLVYALVILILTKKDIRYGIGGYIFICIFPNIQGREIFGITGFNAMNIIFLGVVLKYYLPRFSGRIKIKSDKLPLIEFILILLLLQITFMLRYLDEYYLLGNIRSMVVTFVELIVKPIEYYLILYFLYKSINSIKEIKIFLLILISAGVVGVIVLFWQVTITKISYSEIFWNNFAGHKNTWGVKVALLDIITLVTFLLTKNKKWKIFALISFVLGLGVLIFSLSRTAWVAFAVGTIFIMYKSNLKKALLFIPLVFIVISSTPLADKIIERMGRENAEANTSQLNKITAGRVEKKWLPQIEAIEENPLFGGGTVGLLGHSGYLAVWNQIGLLGLLITSYIFIKMYFDLNKIHQATRDKSEFVRIITLTGLTLLLMVPIINITCSVVFFRLNDAPSLLMIGFFYISGIKIKNIYLNEYLKKINFNYNVKQEELQVVK